MITQLNKNQLKQIQNQSQSGRSMVEMLGVLAIIAILSIGGIVGFRLAMNYYQANQIAHEMNMMRTDAQIKIAQGADKLTLGSPYDDKKINFNDYGTDFGCALADDEKVELGDEIFCYVANAYYIELQEIPEGVCKPLARLISGMDNLIDFYVNEPDAEEGEKDICNKDFNTLTVIFGADSDSNAIKCNTKDECPTELPVCLNHMCVECETNTDCIEKDTNNPICNKNTHTCEPCPPKSAFYEGECHEYECRSNEDCADKGDGFYCYLYEGYRWDSEWENKPGTYFGGSCHKAEEDKILGGITHYVKSKDIMTWWSAQRFCEALNMTPVSSSDIGCGDVNELDCCTSNTVTNLRNDFPIAGTYGLWMEIITNPNSQFPGAIRSIFLNNGAIDPDNRADGDGTPNYGFCHH